MARTILEFEYNRNRGVKMTPLEVSFLTDDKNGHEFHVSIVDNHGDVDLSGCTAEGKFIADDQGREDDITIDLTGRVDGNVAILPLKEDCYKLTGRFTLTIKVKQGEDTLATVFWGTGNVLRSGSRRVSVPETVMYLPITGTAANSAKLGGKPPEAYSAVNLLDNSNFAKLIAQAGLGAYEKNANGTYVYTGMHGNTPYAAERWKNHGCTVTQHDGFARLTTPLKGRIYQTMENIAGKTVTIAAKIKGGGQVYVGIYYLTPDGSNTGSIAKSTAAPDGILCVSGTIPAGARDIEARIYPAYEDNGGYSDVYWAALYEGVYTAETLPAYTAEKYSAELMECLRYFHVYATAAARPSNGLDCSPPMRLNAVSQGTVVVNGVTYYYNSADL